MRSLSPGDVDRKLALIEHSGRSRRWKKRARAHLIKDLKAEYVPGTRHLDTPRGRVCSKRRFPTFLTAFHALMTAQASPNLNRHETRAYSCKHCHQWHLTSRDFMEFPNDRAEESTDRYRRQKGQGEGHRDSDTKIR